MTTKVEQIKNILNEFDSGVLEQCIFKYRRLERHPWMKYRKDQIEMAATLARDNYYKLELGGNIKWYGYISKHLKK